MWTNTREFHREADHFLKYGYYCPDHKGTDAWRKYWLEQTRRCVEGYTVGGQYITGEHYDYLNFNQIRLTRDEERELLLSKDPVTKGDRHSRTSRIKSKIVSFPSFWDSDAFFFKELQEARIAGQHFACSKARRKGYSYKAASIANNRAQHYKNSYTIIGAYLSNYLSPKGTFAMTKQVISFYNEHTAWAKNRHFIDRDDIKRFSFKEFKNGIPIEKGFKSTLSMVTFKDNAEAAVGQDNDLVILDEACKFPNLKDVFKFTEPTTSDGGYTTGLILMFGAGGTGDASRDFESIFYNPEFYNVRCYENVWEEGMTGSVSFFVPNYWNKPGYMDKNGNSLAEEARVSDLKEREIKKKYGSRTDYEGFISQRCHTPAESFITLTGSVFPVDELKKWEKMLMHDTTLKHIGNNGKLYTEEDGKVSFKISDTVKPIHDFPLKKDQNKEGCVIVYENPIKVNGVVPEGVYLIGHDPYAHDTGTSLGSTFVYKRPSKYDSSGEYIVAAYTGRPSSIEKYNIILFNLAKYYNAKIGFENDRGDVISHAKRFKKLDLLSGQFTLLDKQMGGTSTKRGYGMHMTEDRKRIGESYIHDWLLTERNENADGTVNLNMHTIYDLGLVRELIKYNPTIKGKFDRVIAFMVALFHNYERSNAYIYNENRDEVYEDEYFQRVK